MVRSLVDLCLFKIERNISGYVRLGRKLSPRHKEILIERLCWHRSLVPQDLPAITYNLFAPNLMRINFSFSDQVNDRLLQLLADSGCYPEYITINNCPKVTNYGIRFVAKISRRAEEIVLTRLPNINGSSFLQLGSPFLSSIDLHGCSKITDHGVSAIMHNCPNIKVMNLSWLYLLTDSAVSTIAETLKHKLVELDISGLNQVTSASTSALALHCTNLRKVNLEGCVRINGIGVVELAASCKLRDLNLSVCRNITDDTMQEILSESSLRQNVCHLQVNGLALKQDSFDMLASLQHITSLSLCGIVTMTDSVLHRVCLTAGVRLVELFVSHCPKLTETITHSISKYCVNLRALSLMNIAEITGAGLKTLLLDDKRAEKITDLQLSGCKMFDVDIVRMATVQCPNMEVFLLAALKGIDDEVATCIAHNLPKLKRLSLKNASCSDEAVMQIANHCADLRVLVLSGNHDLTDKSVLFLASRCPHLTELYLSGCAKVTRAAVQFVADTGVSRLYFEHQIPNAPQGLLMAHNLDSGEFVRVDKWYESLEQQEMNRCYTAAF